MATARVKEQTVTLLKALQDQSEAVVAIYLAEINGIRPRSADISKLKQAHSVISTDIDRCDRILALANRKGVDIFKLSETDLLLLRD